MNFGFGSNWREAPKQNIIQHSINFSRMTQNKKMYTFGQPCLKPSDGVFDDIGNVSNWNRLFSNSIILNKNFNTPFDSTVPNKMQAIENDDLLKNFTDAPSPSHGVETQKQLRARRVDFYPVFVGVSNFFTGLVNNLTSSSKQSSVNGVNPNNARCNLPIIIPESDSTAARTVRRDISPDENTTSNRNIAKSAVSGCVSVNGTRKMSGDVRDPATSVVSAPNGQGEVDESRATLPEDQNMPEPVKKSIDPATVAACAESDIENNTCVISSCEDKLQKLKELLSIKKLKSRRRGSNGVDNTNHSAPPATEACLTEADSIQEETGNPIKSIQKECSKQMDHQKDKSGAISIPDNKRCGKSKSRSKTEKVKKVDGHEDTTLGQEVGGGSLTSSLDTPRQPVPSRKPLRSILKSSAAKCASLPSKLKPESSFDELKGRFKKPNRNPLCDSDDSFVIVFQDSDHPDDPPVRKQRLSSECDSEDSFVICFESGESEPNCFTNQEVFRDEDSSSDSDLSCDSDSESEEPSCVLVGSLSRTIGDLTDERLFSDPDLSVSNASVEKFQCTEYKGGDDVDVSAVALANPVKQVRFTCEAPRVHLLCTWAFAHRAARVGPWQRFANDRVHFKRRIADVDLALSWVLKPQHRARVLFQRIMPWRHAQRRLELAEAKKKKEEAERIKKEKEEEERIKKEKEEEERIKKEKEEEERIKKEKEEEELAKKEINGEAVVICDVYPYNTPASSAEIFNGQQNDSENVDHISVMPKCDDSRPLTGISGRDTKYTKATEYVKSKLSKTEINENVRNSDITVALQAGAINYIDAKTDKSRSGINCAKEYRDTGTLPLLELNSQVEKAIDD